MSALTPPTPVAAAKRAVIGNSLRFHWSLSQAGNTFRIGYPKDPGLLRAVTIHFEIESVWFERHQLEMLPEDHAWCVKIVGRYRKVIDHWNDSGPWVNVRFGP